jgi:SAM-dependent methyltransferase
MTELHGKEAENALGRAFSHLMAERKESSVAEHPAASYWNRGAQRVPSTTGAETLMDACDFEDITRALGVQRPIDRCLDVGCGTGRVARHCDYYLGVDISSDAVKYCKARGLTAHVIEGPEHLVTLLSDLKEPPGSFDAVLALSVFTHIDADERTRYLHAFTQLANYAIVDVIPGSGKGDVALWTADTAQFERSIAHCGWAIRHTYDRPSPEGVEHRYYLLD